MCVTSRFLLSFFRSRSIHAHVINIMIWLLARVRIFSAVSFRGLEIFSTTCIHIYLVLNLHIFIYIVFSFVKHVYT